MIYLQKDERGRWTKNGVRGENRVVGRIIVGRWEPGLRTDFGEWHDKRIEEWRTIF